MYRRYRYSQPSGGDGGGILVLILMMMPVMAAIAYIAYKKYRGEDPFGFLNENKPVFKFEMVNGQPVFTSIEPSDCSGSVYVKKKGCHNRDTGELFDGSAGKCGDGVEEWVLDPNAEGYQRALGNGKCESEFRPCNVVCDKPCEGNTWTPGECQRNGVVLDGSSSEKCGQGMLTKTLDETAPDYKPAQGRGSCTKNYGSACFVQCPANIVPPRVCVYQTNWIDTNKCVKTKDDRADEVGYDEDGWQLSFKLALEAENCEGEDRLIEWKTCTGPPTPINCAGSWTTSDSTDPDGWGPCQGTCGTQPTQSRTYRVSTEAQHGGRTDTCLHPNAYTERRNCGAIQQCCEVGSWVDGTCESNGFKTQTRTLTENSPGACANYDETRSVACCYQAGDWANIPNEYCRDGKIKMKQTTAGNCPSGTDTEIQDCNFCEGYWMKNNTDWCYGNQLRRYYKYVKTKDASANVSYKNCSGTPGYTSWHCIANSCPSGTPSLHDDYAAMSDTYSIFSNFGWTRSNPRINPGNGSGGCNSYWVEEK